MKIFYKRSPLLNVLLLPLIIVSIIFKYITGIRRLLYMRGVLPSYRAESRIISVGNITVGGTGKTPMVMYVCTLLAGKNLAIVSRGYGSKGKGIRIVSDGKKILLGPEICGDEPYLIAKSIRNAVIAVGEKKTEVIRFIEKHYKPDIIILDDGFSHLKVKRDLDIVLIDGEKGFGNGHLLPAGPLRESIGAMRYADIIGVKGKILTEEKRLKKYALSSKFFHFNYSFNGMKTIDHDDMIDITNIKNKKILAMAGIAFPDGLFRLLDSVGIHPFQCIAKSDHSTYDKNKLNSLVEQYAPDVIIVTAKDAVKLKNIERDNRIIWLYADITIKEQGEEVRRILKEKGFLE